MLSMLPLLYRDHLILPYVALLTLFAFTHYSPYRRCNKGGIDSSVLQKVLMTSSLLCSLVLHLIYLTLQPPKKYPFLFEALIMILCFSQFVIITIYANWKQWMSLDCSVELEKAKKTLWSVIWQTATISLWKLIYFHWTEVIVFYTYRQYQYCWLFTGFSPTSPLNCCVCKNTVYPWFLVLNCTLPKIDKKRKVLFKNVAQVNLTPTFSSGQFWNSVGCHVLNFDFWLFDSVKTVSESLN